MLNLKYISNKYCIGTNKTNIPNKNISNQILKINIQQNLL